jgi:GntR family transcriptional regulator/MocR family aminotransferase
VGYGVPKKPGGVGLEVLELQRNAAPLNLQIYRSLRGAILARRLAPGVRLPSTRSLASDLAVSRNTVEEAFSRLRAEGFIERRTGDGTYVAIIDRVLQPEPSARAALPSAARRLAARAAAFTPSSFSADPSVPRAFSGGSAAVEAFPLDIWRGLVSRGMRRLGRRSLGYGDPAGYGPLREAIASYVATSRGVMCQPEQVIVLTSSQQALDVAIRVLTDPGDAVWLEEPGYPGARAAFILNGARIVPVPVDGDGLQVSEGVRAAPDARLAYVTPSHQYPLGVTMSLERRLELLDWARGAGAWIIEDDYDGEFRFDGRSPAAIQGIDQDARVVYTGTFSKVLFPSIRLAYAIVPADLVAPFTIARGLLDGHTALLHQVALAEFFAEGHFGVHVRRLRGLYRERRDVLVDEVNRTLAGRMRLGPADGGMHVVGYLADAEDDVRTAARAAEEGVDVHPLARYYVGPPAARGLVLGYGALAPDAIRAGVQALARCL